MRFFQRSPATPEPPESPESALRNVGRWTLVIAGINLAAGILGVVFRWDVVVEQCAGVISLAAAAVYGVIGLLALRGVRYAAPAAVIVFGLDSLAAIAGVFSGGNTNTIWLVTRFFLVYTLIQAARAALARSSQA